MAVHKPIVSKELFDAVEDRARRNETRIKDALAMYPQRRAHRDGRLYVLRGRMHPGPCRTMGDGEGRGHGCRGGRA